MVHFPCVTVSLIYPKLLFLTDAYFGGEGRKASKEGGTEGRGKGRRKERKRKRKKEKDEEREKISVEMRYISYSEVYQHQYS